MIHIVLTFITTFLISLLMVCYIYKKWAWSYWTRKGLNSYEPRSFKDLGEQFCEAYFHFKKNNQKHGGTYLFFQPFYIPVDLDILKQILIGDFGNFVNRGLFPYEKDDPTNAHLFNLEDQRWRNARNNLTPTFTSGKIRNTFETLKKASQALENVLRESSSSRKPVEMKDTAARYSTDVILSVAFGIEAHTLENPHSEFGNLGKLLLDNIDSITILLFLLLKLPKFLQRIFFHFNKRKMSKGQFENETIKKFFVNALHEVVEFREKNNIHRNDFLELLLRLKNGGRVDEGPNDSSQSDKATKASISLNELTSHCFVFYIGGFDTSSTSITHTLVELAKNTEIQEKLRREIHEVLARNDEKLSYDSIMEMKYLDQVVNESLRLHPAAKFLVRKCKQGYTVPGTDFTLEKDRIVLVPIWAIHADPDLYPEPEKFDPNRFSPENKAHMHPLQHIPFGEGPRMCIGSRFGYIQIKVALTTILNKFRVSLNEKTEIPPKGDKSFLSTAIRSGVWLNIEEI